MGLMDLMNEVSQNFNPVEDKVSSGPELWPNGTYTVMLGERTGYRVNQFFGSDEVNVELEIIDGDFAGQKDFHALSFEETMANGKPVPKMILNKNIKEAMQLFAVTDTPADDSVWESTETLGDALASAIGKPFELEFSTSPNKKRPEYPYKNYNYARLENVPETKPTADPFKQVDNAPDINDDDMPF